MNFLKFFHTVGKLKELKRAGWVKNNVPEPESIAEHSFRMAIMAMVLAPKMGVDQLKTVKMALVHDVGEAGVGDIITMNGNKIVGDPIGKAHQEKEALEKIFSSTKLQEYLPIFEEFEAEQTKEAILVKELDKLEMAIQAEEYENKYDLNLESFFETTRSKISDPYLKQLLKEIESHRPKVINSGHNEE